jgi:tRNA pseudouridine32 synthase/23S rRNA pseudouridine746 synthase
VARPDTLELGDGTQIPILYEDRAVVAVDKPAGWLLVPTHWQQTSRNLQAAIESSLAAGARWARARNLRFLRYVHRLDAETSGALLLARSRGALQALGALFENRQVGKRYLAVVAGTPTSTSWVCRLPLGSANERSGRVPVDRQGGREAETRFTVLASTTRPGIGAVSLVEARPQTGRTHQIRAHLAADGWPVVGDTLYGGPPSPAGLALRAVELTYRDPFDQRPVRIVAPEEAFLAGHGFERRPPGTPLPP